MPEYHLAQLNIAIPKAPLDSPAMADFMNALDRINGIADSADGFVWRLQTEAGNATSLRPFGDDTMVKDLRATRLFDLMEELVNEGEKKLGIVAGQLGIKSGRADRYPESNYKLHGRLGELLLDSDKRAAWRHRCAFRRSWLFCHRCSSRLDHGHSERTDSNDLRACIK